MVMPALFFSPIPIPLLIRAFSTVAVFPCASYSRHPLVFSVGIILSLEVILLVLCEEEDLLEIHGEPVRHRRRETVRLPPYDFIAEKPAALRHGNGKTVRDLTQRFFRDVCHSGDFPLDPLSC